MEFLKTLFGNKKKKPTWDKQFETLVLKSSLASASVAKISIEDSKNICKFLQGRTSLSVENAQQQFFEMIESGTFGIPAQLKIATMIHRCILELGDSFSTTFLEYKLESLQQKQQKQKKKRTVLVESYEWLRQNIFEDYFSYLQRLANNQQIYHICAEVKNIFQDNLFQNSSMFWFGLRMRQKKDGKLPLTDDAKLDYKLKFMWLFKISNIFTLLIRIRVPLEKALKELPNILFLKDIALLVLHDCISFYTVMSSEIKELALKYPLLVAVDAIQFYQLYVELKNLTEQLKQFCQIKRLFDQDDLVILPSTWFSVDAKTHKEIESYAKKIELLHAASSFMRRTLRQNDTSSKQQCKSGVNFTETALQTEEPKYRKAHSSVHDGNISNRKVNISELCYKFSEFLLSFFNDFWITKKSARRYSDTNDYIFMEDEELNAIRRYEQLLCEQKMYEEGNQKEQHQYEICFSPGKPYTFRCEKQTDKKVEKNDKKSNKQEQQDIKLNQDGIKELINQGNKDNSEQNEQQISDNQQENRITQNEAKYEKELNKKEEEEVDGPSKNEQQVDLDEEEKNQAKEDELYQNEVINEHLEVKNPVENPIIFQGINQVDDNYQQKQDISPDFSCLNVKPEDVEQEKQHELKTQN